MLKIAQAPNVPDRDGIPGAIGVSLTVMRALQDARNVRSIVSVMR